MKPSCVVFAILDQCMHQYVVLNLADLAQQYKNGDNFYSLNRELIKVYKTSW